MKTITVLIVLSVCLLAGWYFGADWVSLGVNGAFCLAVFTAILMVMQVLGSNGWYICGLREGYVTIFTEGVKNGVFIGAAGAMKGYSFDRETGRIWADVNAKKMGFMGFVWIGPWPTCQAAEFEAEQVKLINAEDSSLGYKVEKYKKSIYIAIKTSEQLLCKELELSDLATKINFDVLITFVMINARVAKMDNRGNAKVFKAHALEGMREIASRLDYKGALALRNATGKAQLLKLKVHLNGVKCGFGSVGETTGYEVESIIITGVELSGSNAQRVIKAYEEQLLAEKEVAASATRTEQDAKNIERLGQASANAAAAMLEVTKGRIDAQAKLSGLQALGLGIENNRTARAIGIGGSGLSAIVDTRDDDDEKKKDETAKPGGKNEDKPDSGKKDGKKN